MLRPLRFYQGQRVKLSSSAPFTPNYVQTSVTLSSDPVGIYNNRVKGRQIMLENPARDSKAKRERNEKKVKRAAQKLRRKANGIGRREANEKGTWKLEEEQTKCVVQISAVSPPLISHHSGLTCSCHYIVSGWVTCLSCWLFPCLPRGLLTYNRCPTQLVCRLS